MAPRFPSWVSTLVLVLLALPATAAPRILAVFPAGGQRGTTVTVTLQGDGLKDLSGFFPLGNYQITLDDPLANTFLNYHEKCSSFARSVLSTRDNFFHLILFGKVFHKFLKKHCTYRKTYCADIVVLSHLRPGQ